MPPPWLSAQRAQWRPGTHLYPLIKWGRGVTGLNSTKVNAIHPNWTGVLQLSGSGRSVVHEGHGSKGTYTLSNDTLTILWDKFAPDVFINVSGLYLHQTVLSKLPDIEHIAAVKVGGKIARASKVSILLPDHDYEVCLRLGTTDVPTFVQVFVNSEYETPYLPETAEAIVDLGANIGLATVFFGTRYPGAKILSIEPEAGNFTMMLANTAALGDRISRRQAAVWTRDGFITLRTEDTEGRPLGAWGVQVDDETPRPAATVACHKLATLLDDAGFDSVDILKIDIEGAELELFSESVVEWLPRIKSIIVETHDRFRPGADAAVRNAVGPMFEELPRSGENLIFRRR